MAALVAAIIGLAIFVTVSYVTTLIIDYKKYQAFVENKEFQKGLEKAIDNATIEIIKAEEKKEEVKEKKKPGRKKKVEEEK